MSRQWCWHCNTIIEKDEVVKQHKTRDQNIYFHKACVAQYRKQIIKNLVGMK